MNHFILKRPLDTRFIRFDQFNNQRDDGNNNDGDESENEIEIRGMERTMDSFTDVPTAWQTYFSLDG